ncbi:hypothetical protein D9M68_676310 [compost metagenome]
MAPQSESSGAALSVAQLNQARLPGKYLHRQFSAVLARHHPLDAFDDIGDRRTIITELLGAVLNGNSRLPATHLVAGADVRVLETPPAADVINQNGRVVRPPILNIIEKPFQRFAPLKPQTTFACVAIDPDDVEGVGGGIQTNRVELVFGRILLVLGGHPDISRGRSRASFVLICPGANKLLHRQLPPPWPTSALRFQKVVIGRQTAEIVLKKVEERGWKNVYENG